MISKAPASSSRRRYGYTTGIVLSLLLCPQAFSEPVSGALSTNEISAHRVVSGRFSDVYEALEFALADRGLTISHVSHIDKMLQRTAAAVGAEKPLYLAARSVAFCSAGLSRDMMEADIHHIIFCPYNILIYETAANPGQVHLAYRLLQAPGATPKSRQALAAIEALLSDILSATVEF